MILIVSYLDDAHVPFVTPSLDKAGVEYRWIDSGQVPARAEVRVAYDRGGIVSRTFHQDGRRIDLDEATAVWYRHPTKPVAAPETTDERQREWVRQETEALLAGLGDTLDCLWVPGKPHRAYAARNKTNQLALAARLGLQVPRTLITNSPEAFLDFYSECNGRLVTKTLYDPRVDRDGERHATFTRPVRRRDVARYRSIRHAPLIAQEYVPKRIELRIMVVGSRVLAAEIHSQASHATRDDWRHYDFDRTPHSRHELPDEVAARCVRLVETLGLCFGAIDMVLTPDREYVFLELNPNGQWAWIQDLTALPISEAIADLLMSPQRAGGVVAAPV